MIKTVFLWLKGLPGLETLQQEALAAAPGSSGLFCQGRRELSRTQDILGVTHIRQSLTFQLCLHSVSRQVPDFLLQLDTAGAPVLGTEQTVTVTRGRLVRDGGTGICRYEAAITFTFTSEG